MSEQIKLRFETSGDLTSELLRKTCMEFMAKYRMSKQHRVMIALIWVMLVVDAILTYMYGNELMWRFIVVGAAYVLLDPLLEWSVRRTTKMTVKRFEEEHHTGVTLYTTAFSDTQVHLRNHGSGATGTIDLSNMKRLKPVEDAWVLATKTWAFIPIFVTQLSETEKVSLLELLRQNNPKIKIDLPKKK